MPRYTIRQLTYLVAVADAGSISGAAEQLNVSPTAIAAALTELERIFRSQLMVRRKAHGIVLTPTGTYAYQRAIEVLKAAEELELAVASGGDEISGPLVAGCYATVAPTIVPVLLDWFVVHHPKVQLSFVEAPQTELPHRLLRGELDLAVVYDMDLPPGLASVTLYEASAYVLLPGDHRLAGSPRVSLHDLVDERLILLDAPPSGQHTLSLFGAAGLTPRIGYRTGNFELTRSLVGRGMGYAVLVQRPAGDSTYEGRTVVAKEISPSVRPVGVKIIWPESVRLTDRARAMVDVAAHHVAAHHVAAGHGFGAVGP